MIIRILVFIIIVIIFTILAFAFIKDLGENRRRIEKEAKDKVTAIKNSKQEIWKQGPKRKR